MPPSTAARSRIRDPATPAREAPMRRRSPLGARAARPRTAADRRRRHAPPSNPGVAAVLAIAVSVAIAVAIAIAGRAALPDRAAAAGAPAAVARPSTFPWHQRIVDARRWARARGGNV